MKKYKYIFFDLFDTLIDFDYSRLPLISVDGEKHNSTSGLVYEVLNKHYPNISFDVFYKPFMDTFFEFQEIKKKDNKEYPNQQRFSMLFDKLKLNHQEAQNVLLNNMTEAHMTGLASATTFPEENRNTLDYLKDKEYKFVLISNFDYAPTAYELLDRYDLRNYFEKIYISIEVGWRKPSKKIFQKALDDLKLEITEAIHIGDNYSADIIGANEVGIDTVWLNKKQEASKDQYTDPDYTIYNLPELNRIF